MASVFTVEGSGDREVPERHAMQNSQFEVAESVDLAVGTLFRQFGLWAVLRAVFNAMLAQRQRTNGLSQLSNRMLQDIGVPVEEDLLRPKGFSFWDIRP